jgi:protein tyrosine phosphatase
MEIHAVLQLTCNNTCEYVIEKNPDGSWWMILFMHLMRIEDGLTKSLVDSTDKEVPGLIWDFLAFCLFERNPNDGCEILSCCCGRTGIMVALKFVKTHTQQQKNKVDKQ